MSNLCKARIEVRPMVSKSGPSGHFKKTLRYEWVLGSSQMGTRNRGKHEQTSPFLD